MSRIPTRPSCSLQISGFLTIAMSAVSASGTAEDSSQIGNASPSEVAKSLVEFPPHLRLFQTLQEKKQVQLQLGPSSPVGTVLLPTELLQAEGFTAALNSTLTESDSPDNSRASNGNRYETTRLQYNGHLTTKGQTTIWINRHDYFPGTVFLSQLGKVNLSLNANRLRVRDEAGHEKEFKPGDLLERP